MNEIAKIFPESSSSLSFLYSHTILTHEHPPIFIIALPQPTITKPSTYNSHHRAHCHSPMPSSRASAKLVHCLNPAPKPRTKLPTSTKPHKLPNQTKNVHHQPSTVTNKPTKQFEIRTKSEERNRKRNREERTHPSLSSPSTVAGDLNGESQRSKACSSDGE
ncbi:hypothetical protein GQ457_12G017620 [Hibiscus cannabinus]